MFKIFATASATAALMAGAAIAQDDTMMIEADQEAMMMSMADGQTMVTFPRITTREDGYIVLHAVADGAPVVPDSMGHAMVMAGENTDVMVTIPQALPAGTELVAMLHAETNGNGVYDFGEGMTDVDGPIMVNGAPVTATFVVPEGMEMDHDMDAMETPEVEDPQTRSASDDSDDPDYRDEGEDEIEPNDTEVDGFLEEGEEDADNESDDDDAATDNQ